MKRILSTVLALCLLAALIGGCAGELPALPPLPDKEEPSAPAESAAPEEAEADVVVIEDEPAPVVKGEEKLSLRFTLPALDETREELAYYFSPAAEFDCAFAYPAYCALWAENGSIRLDPGWFFARMFFTGVDKDAEGAPETLLGMLEPGKWSSSPSEITVGSGFSALRMNNLKYDTWRRWIVWETPERYYQLYGVCFDGREEDVAAIFEVIASSFRTSAELLAEASESGTPLREYGELSLSYDGAELRSAQNGPVAELRLSIDNRSGQAFSFSVSAPTADGSSLSFDESCSLEDGESLVWTLSLPLTSEDGAFYETLALSVAAHSEGEEIFELPVQIELNK